MNRLIEIAAAVAAATAASAAAEAQDASPAMDLMPIADTDSDGKITPEEYRIFSEQGWVFVSQGAEKVKVAELDPMAQLAFFSIAPDAEGYVTREMYLAAIPTRFRLFDSNGDGALDSDELNGRAFRQN